MSKKPMSGQKGPGSTGRKKSSYTEEEATSILAVAGMKKDTLHIYNHIVKQLAPFMLKLVDDAKSSFKLNPSGDLSKGHYIDSDLLKKESFIPKTYPDLITFIAKYHMAMTNTRVAREALSRMTSATKTGTYTSDMTVKIIEEAARDARRQQDDFMSSVTLQSKLPDGQEKDKKLQESINIVCGRIAFAFDAGIVLLRVSKTTINELASASLPSPERATSVKLITMIDELDATTSGN